MEWIIFIVGVFTGAGLGLFCMGLMRISAESDKTMDKQAKERINKVR